MGTKLNRTMNSLPQYITQFRRNFCTIGTAGYRRGHTSRKMYFSLCQLRHWLGTLRNLFHFRAQQRWRLIPKHASFDTLQNKAYWVNGWVEFNYIPTMHGRLVQKLYTRRPCPNAHTVLVISEAVCIDTDININSINLKCADSQTRT